MTPQQYIAALARLGLTPASKAAAEAIGKTVRTSQRYATGEKHVPKTVEMLLNAKESVRSLEFTAGNDPVRRRV